MVKVLDLNISSNASYVHEDCIALGSVYFSMLDRTRYFCPTAVTREGNVSLGAPYEWLCPEKEPHETRPTCFVDESIGQGWNVLI